MSNITCQLSTLLSPQHELFRILKFLKNFEVSEFFIDWKWVCWSMVKSQVGLQNPYKDSINGRLNEPIKCVGWSFWSTHAFSRAISGDCTYYWHDHHGAVLPGTPIIQTKVRNNKYLLYHFVRSRIFASSNIFSCAKKFVK